MLFIYGTLQDADVLGAVLGRPLATAGLRRALALRFRVVTYPGRVYPALVPASVGAPGLLLEELSRFDLAVLDAFEGAEYRREAITVPVEGVQRHADAYLPRATIPATAPAWSLAHWTITHKPSVLKGEIASAATLRQRLAPTAD